MEIERKYLIRQLPEHLDAYPCAGIEQAYLCVEPVIRVRRENNDFYVTCKGRGMLAREECNFPMSRETYERLLLKAEGSILSKKRYRIPLACGLTAELDVFSGCWEGLILAEVEFPDLEAANRFVPPKWFGAEVTYDGRYHNSWMSTHTPDDIS